MNSVKTVLLLGLLSGVVLVIGEWAGGRQGLMIGLLIAAHLQSRRAKRAEPGPQGSRECP